MSRSESHLPLHRTSSVSLADRFGTQPDPCIHDLFEEQVRRTPEAIAALWDGGELTYGELNRRADSLAFRLQQLGVKPEAHVGVRLDKSPELLVAILGVLKAGGAYVPIDPQAPPERLENAQLQLIASLPNSQPLPSTAACLVVHLDRMDGPASVPSGKPAKLARPAHLAYIIYTSGSTGRPKGVAVEHRSLVASTLARRDRYPVPQIFLLLSAVAFDSAVAGIFGTLTRGGALCFPPPNTESDARAMCRLIARHGVDTTLTLPSFYELLIESSEPGQLASLRTVTVAGERCPATLPIKSRDRLPAVELFNEYGPTEATVWSTVWKADKNRPPTDGPVPIGRPVAGARISIVDSTGRSVSDGSPGELCLAGPTLARGYVGRPALTARAFEADPNGPPGSRRYRTGDRVRFRPDGELEFLGRLDRQLKIRGYRVEPAEIEDAILSLPGVRQAVVAPARRQAQTTLIAFILGDADADLVRDHLFEKLPSYLVPAEIAKVAEFPLTPNGKIDTDALTDARAREFSAAEADAPASALERTVTTAWCEILDLPRIPRTQSFFELGSSLEAIKVSLRLSEMFQTEIPMLWIYEAATVELLATWLLENVDGARRRADALERTATGTAGRPKR
ncbi:non-ribosomal peptide synthetase [Actinomadura nitritigenes]|uniref:non-ribosomal peptide synthetase n=1 Tax=Actinomadura nitritigenes TaxID=134602 RepID=UPI003D925A84